MMKIYVESSMDDGKLEQLIYEMDIKYLRIFLYGIARGWGFDESCKIAMSAVKSDMENNT